MSTLYCIDTSTVIDAGERHYPIDVFPAFWERLDVLIAEKRLKAPETLIDELEGKDDAWRAWVYDRKDQMIWTIDADIQQAMKHVMSAYSKQVTNLNSIKGDPFFIAAAMAKGGVLITSEKPRKGGAKIPKLCEALGVDWCPLLDVVRREGWKF